MLLKIRTKPCWYTSSKKKKPRVIIEQNCETSRCFVLWFGFSEQRESFSPWRMRRREAPFLQKHPTCAARLSWEQQQPRSLCKLFCCPCCCWKEFYELRKARASGAHHAEPGGRCTIKRKRSLYRTMNSTVQKTYTIHTCEYFVCWDHHQGQISLSTFSNASSSSSSWCEIMTGMNNVVCDWY